MITYYLLAASVIPQWRELYNNCIGALLRFSPRVPIHGEKLFVNFTLFIRKFIIFIVTLGHTQNVGFLLF